MSFTTFLVSFVPDGDVGGEINVDVDEEVGDPQGILDWQPRRGQGVSDVDHLVCQKPKSLCVIRIAKIAAFFIRLKSQIHEIPKLKSVNNT